jgi:hypothetical protein
MRCLQNAIVPVFAIERGPDRAGSGILLHEQEHQHGWREDKRCANPVGWIAPFDVRDKAGEHRAQYREAAIDCDKLSHSYITLCRLDRTEHGDR